MASRGVAILVGAGDAIGAAVARRFADLIDDVTNALKAV